MADPDVTVRRADDPGYVEELLAANGLPADDVGAERARFYVAHAGGERVGIGGLEPYGEVGLLRSVVIEESARGKGYGGALCGALEDAAAREGVRTLYLLTTTAAGFFAGRGYEEVDRGEVPAAIRRTRQFEDLCPASATCMRAPL